MHSSTTESALIYTYGGVRLDEAASFYGSVGARLEALARARTNAAYLTIESAECQRTLTYGELERLSRRIAAFIQDQFADSPQAPVALLPRNDIESVVAIFGALRSGRPLLLLNPSDPAERLRTQVDAVSAAAVLHSPACCAVGIPVAIPVAEITASTALDGVEPSKPAGLMSPAFLFGTSGSTAASKIVAQSHGNVVANAYAVIRHHGLTADDRVLGCLPFHHVNGVHFTLIATLMAGAHAVVVETFDPFAFMPLLARIRPRLASLVPSILEALLDSGAPVTLPDEFRYFVSAAAALTTVTAQRVAEQLGAKVHQGYGLTETTNFSATVPSDISDAAYRRLVRDAGIPSIGTAVYGNDMCVLRSDGRPAALEEIGEICMRGHNVMIGYAGNVDATSEAFRDGWFHSGDLGFEVVDSESSAHYFMISGRIKNIAKVGGESVSLEEMERVLRTLPEVVDAACVSRPHRLLGEEVVAAIVSTEEPNADHIRRQLRKTFAAMALPRLVVRVTGIPRTPTGKIRRGELVDLVAGQERAS